MPAKLSITTTSLGLYSAGHSLVEKLNAAHKYGYQGVELFSDDLYDFAHRAQGRSGSQVGDSISPAALISASRQIATLCRSRSLEVISLQPFRHYEGLRDRDEHARRIEELKLWFTLAHELGTDLIGIPSTFLPSSQLTGGLDLAVADLREAADLAAAASPPIRLAFESLCWGTLSDLWETSWEIVQRVDRINFGLCLDTFNIAGRIFADPAHPSGKNGLNPEQAVAESMARLVAQVDRNRVFLVQVVDAQRLDKPLIPGHEYYVESQPCRMSWSRNCRLFYGEESAYLPIRQISWAIFQGIGYDGWVSLELFNKRMADRGLHVVDELARRGAESWKKLVRDVKIKAAPLPSRELSEKTLMSAL